MFFVWRSLHLVTLLLIQSGISFADPTVIVRPLTEVTQNRQLRLNDIAEFIDVDAATMKTLGGIPLAQAPKVGEKLELSGTALSMMLRNHKEWSIGLQPTFKIPSRVVIQNSSDQLNESQLRLEVVERWQSLCQCRIELSELSLPKMDPWIYGTEWHIRWPNEMPKGSFTLQVELKQPKGASRILWIRGRMSLFKQVPVAQRQIYFGERIQKEDFSMMDRDVTFARDAAGDAQEVIGRRAKQGIASQDIIFKGTLEREKALKRGDSVKVAMGELDWEVALVGVAEQDGFIGDTVKVRNLKSQQIIVATVTGQGEAKAQ